MSTGWTLAWQVYFWFLAVSLVLPLPFKLHAYATGRDPSPTAVKIEEMANLALALVGLAGLFGLAYGHEFGTAWLWRGWVVLELALSLLVFTGTPKLRYAESVMGVRRTRITMAVGTALLLPLLVGVWHYAALVA